MNIRPHRFCSMLVSLALLSVTTACASTHNPDSYPSLKMQGDVYPSVCTPDQLAKLQVAVHASNPTAPEQLWRAVEVMLCAPGDNAHVSFIRTLVPAKVKRSAEATGDTINIKYVAKSSALIHQLFAEGKAWGASVVSDDNKLTLQYFVNEACVASRTLILVKGKWYIAEIVQACD